jgi:hypothetical protein
MFAWSVDGTNQLKQQSFFYRAGSAGAEAPIYLISAPTLSTPNARTLYQSYDNGSYRVEVDYTLTGGALGSGQAGLQESITISNHAASTIDFHLFQYSDYGVAGTSSNDVSQCGRSLSGLFNEAVQSENTRFVVETVVTPGANHCEAALYPTTFGALTNGTPTTLSDAAGPVGPGDVTWALQWDFSIPAGKSVIIGESARFATNGVAGGAHPSIAINRNGTSVTVSWPGGYVLQNSTNVAGPYGDVPGAASPYSVSSTSKPKEFFGLRN